MPETPTYDLDPSVTPAMREQLLQKLKTLPSSPGVYFHKNADNEVIYVGKAAVLKIAYGNISTKPKRIQKL